MTTNIEVNELKINKMSEATLSEMESAGTIEPNQIYMTDDDETSGEVFEKIANKTNDVEVLKSDYFNSTKYPTINLMSTAIRGLDTFGTSTFSSVDDVLAWVKNTAPSGCYLKYMNINGGRYTFIIQKTSSQYAAVYYFNYNTGDIFQHRMVAGNWTSKGTIDAV